MQEREKERPGEGLKVGREGKRGDSFRGEGGAAGGTFECCRETGEGNDGE